jgi:hypothetical protein
LVDSRLPAPGYVPVTITRGIPASLEYLANLERLWAPERGRLTEELRAHGETLESSHWDWRNKASRPPLWYTLVTIECDGQTQGIVAVENLLRPARLKQDAWVLYVDYLEVAPWNKRVPNDRNKPATREPRYRAVGKALIGEAIRMSIGTTAGGRVGLHGLEQAELFYVNGCGMNRVGPDPHYYDLVYFEYPDGVAATRLTEMELSI